MCFSILMYFHVLTLDYFITAKTALLCAVTTAAASASTSANTATATTTIFWLLLTDSLHAQIIATQVFHALHK